MTTASTFRGPVPVEELGFTLMHEHGPAPYEPVPWFWSDQFGRKLQLAGDPCGYDELLIVAGSISEERFCGLYRRGDSLVAAVTLGAAKPFLISRALLERAASWTDALEAFGRPAAEREILTG